MEIPRQHPEVSGKGRKTPSHCLGSGAKGKTTSRGAQTQQDLHHGGCQVQAWFHHTLSQTTLWMAVFFNLTAAGEAAAESPRLPGDAPYFAPMQSQRGLPRQSSSLQGCSHHRSNTAKVSVPRQATADSWVGFFGGGGGVLNQL